MKSGIVEKFRNLLDMEEAVESAHGLPRDQQMIMSARNRVQDRISTRSFEPFQIIESLPIILTIQHEFMKVSHQVFEEDPSLFVKELAKARDPLLLAVLISDFSTIDIQTMLPHCTSIVVTSCILKYLASSFQREVLTRHEDDVDSSTRYWKSIIDKFRGFQREDRIRSVWEAITLLRINQSRPNNAVHRHLLAAISAMIDQLTVYSDEGSEVLTDEILTLLQQDYYSDYICIVAYVSFQIVDKETASKLQEAFMNRANRKLTGEIWRKPNPDGGVSKLYISAIVQVFVYRWLTSRDMCWKGLFSSIDLNNHHTWKPEFDISTAIDSAGWVLGLAGHAIMSLIGEPESEWMDLYNEWTSLLQKFLPEAEWWESTIGNGIDVLYGALVEIVAKLDHVEANAIIIKTTSINTKSHRLIAIRAKCEHMMSIEDKQKLNDTINTRIEFENSLRPRPTE